MEVIKNYKFKNGGELDDAVKLWTANEYDAKRRYGDIKDWDVSDVKDMSGLFKDNTTFNADISRWDVSSATNMDSMFEGATSFNADISGWDVRNLKSMEKIFFNATNFNQNIGLWPVPHNTEGYTSIEILEGTELYKTLEESPKDNLLRKNKKNGHFLMSVAQMTDGMDYNFLNYWTLLAIKDGLMDIDHLGCCDREKDYQELLLGKKNKIYKNKDYVEDLPEINISYNEKPKEIGNLTKINIEEKPTEVKNKNIFTKIKNTLFGKKEDKVKPIKGGSRYKINYTE